MVAVNVQSNDGGNTWFYYVPSLNSGSINYYGMEAHPDGKVWATADFMDYSSQVLSPDSVLHSR